MINEHFTVIFKKNVEHVLKENMTQCIIQYSTHSTNTNCTIIEP